MKILTKYAAFDGVLHATEAECRAYERRVAHIRMVGLKVEDVEAALTRADLDLADAFEEVATRIKRVRLASGKMVTGEPDLGEPDFSEVEGARGEAQTGEAA